MKAKPCIFLAVAVMVFASCEKQREKPADEKPSSVPLVEKNVPVKPLVEKAAFEIPDVGVGPGALPGTESSDGSEEGLPGSVVAPATLIRLFKEADKAFTDKDYSTAHAKIEELLKALKPHPQEGAPYELLYFNLGLSSLLDGKYDEADRDFKECIQRFPKDDYTSRAFLGFGRACMKQNQADKKGEALWAFRKAAANPKLKEEADRLIGELSQGEANRLDGK